VLSDEDPLWVQYRHNHIGEVIPDVTTKFKEFKKKKEKEEEKEKEKKEKTKKRREKGREERRFNCVIR